MVKFRVEKEFVDHSIPMYRNPVIIQNVRRAMADMPNSNTTLEDIKTKLVCYDLNQAPSKSTISKILHKSLGYAKTNYAPANVKYNDIKFDPKRKFIAKEIGTSLVYEDLVVCIDESSFSTHQYNKKKWQRSASCKKRQ